MPTVSKGVLKAKMLEYFREVESSGEELIVTDKHKPVLKVTPLIARKHPDEVFADARKKFKAREKDVLAPATDYWEDA
jgi:antitoxin (DNA-binding transcriptional repressor) of toxin-antitoxin stability system